MMTVFGVVFERHGRELPVVDEASLPGQALAGNRNPIPATTSTGGSSTKLWTPSEKPVTAPGLAAITVHGRISHDLLTTVGTVR
jgi:hypothetical protein